MLSLNKLEKVIELEEKLRAEYQSQLDEKAAQIDSHTRKQSDLQATIDKQLQTIKDLSANETVNQRVEQLNRELSNRAEKLQEELGALKNRVKGLQKDLAAERAENKTLKQFDPARMKKNLDATKKKLAKKTKANDALQKSLSQSRAENAEQQRKTKELETRLTELESQEDSEEAAA